MVYGDNLELIETLGDWLFGPYPYASRSCPTAVEILVKNTSVLIRYPYDTPIEGIELIDDGITNFLDEYKRGDFDVADIIDFIQQYHTAGDATKLIDQLIDLASESGLGAEAETQTQLGRRGCLDNDYAEANRVILAMGD